MTISTFLTAKDPEVRGDLYLQCLHSAQQFSDEVVVVDGGYFLPTGTLDDYLITRANHPWLTEFEFSFIGEQFQRGYDTASGDWVIHADLDFIFHEGDKQAIRDALATHSESPAVSFYKYQFLLPDRYTLKSRLVLAVNKAKFGHRIRFDSGGDLCQPSLDGEKILPDNVPESGVAFWNYERILKTKPQLREDLGRMARAYERTYGGYKLGGPDEESAYQEFIKMTTGRFRGREHKMVKLEEHPKVMQNTILNLKPENFGYDGHGFLPRCSYYA